LSEEEISLIFTHPSSGSLINKYIDIIKKDKKRQVNMKPGNICQGEKVTVEKKKRSFLK
jgi:hypothetical protein